MRVRVFDSNGKLIRTFPSEMIYDDEFRQNHKILSEKFVGLGDVAENVHHGLVYEHSVLEVVAN